VQVADQVKAISLGTSHTMILKTNNTLWTTGSNIYGQLGIGSTINSNQFTMVTDKVALINAGAQHSVIMKTDGSFWAAGYNDCRIGTAFR
ncbi:chromosome condensation regulator RCC1, partial [Elizabethkingia miricola]|nr:chromosome condensation regulator RCC1 [Elizabethkingia miricola]